LLSLNRVYGHQKTIDKHDGRCPKKFKSPYLPAMARGRPAKKPRPILGLKNQSRPGIIMGVGKPMVFRSWVIQVWVWYLKYSTCVIPYPYPWCHRFSWGDFGMLYLSRG